MIMTFEEYNEYLTNIDFRIAEAGRRITYREIQLIGRQKGASSNSPSLCMMRGGENMTEEETLILENDKTLLALRKEYDRLIDEKFYVIKYAEMPMTASEAIDNCDRLADLWTHRTLNKDKEKED
jgi:hypothetical protein